MAIRTLEDYEYSVELHDRLLEEMSYDNRDLDEDTVEMLWETIDSIEFNIKRYQNDHLHNQSR